MSVEAEPLVPAVPSRAPPSRRPAPDDEQPFPEGVDADRIVPDDDDGNIVPADLDFAGEDDASYPIELFYDD